MDTLIMAFSFFAYNFFEARIRKRAFVTLHIQNIQITGKSTQK